MLLVLLVLGILIIGLEVILSKRIDHTAGSGLGHKNNDLWGLKKMMININCFIVL